MSALINWNTTGQIALESFVAATVIVGAFALGARLLITVDGQARRVAPVALAAVCFAVAAFAVGYGIYFTIDK